MLKRSHTGIFHKMSPNHLNHYVDEYAGKHNNRESDTVAQMQTIYKGLIHKRLKYADLVEENGLSSGTRS